MAVKNKPNWYKLDNAAKIVPSTARGANTRVFRLTCELKEKVFGDVLQTALDETIEEFPFFNCVLHCINNSISSYIYTIWFLPFF